MKHSLSLRTTLVAALFACGAHAANAPAANAQARPADVLPNRAGVDSLNRHVSRDVKSSPIGTAKVKRTAPAIAEIRGASSAPTAPTVPAPARAASTSAAEAAPPVQRSPKAKKP